MLDDLKTQFGSSFRNVRSFLARPITVTAGNVTLGVPGRAVQTQARDEQRTRFRRMRRDLYELMQQHPDARKVMRHLDLLERTLRTEGYAAVEIMPVRALASALAQLERLVWDWTPAGLAELRSRLSILVKTRRAEEKREIAAMPPTDVMPERASGHVGSEMAEVTEVDHAEFEEMERSWAGQMPAGVASALEAAKAGT